MNTVRILRSTGNVLVVGLALGALVAVPAVIAAVASGGAGHGGYVAARALFPAPMLLTLLESGRIGVFSIALGLLQFPICGLLLGWSFARKNWIPSVVLILAHMIAASISFAGALPDFS